MTERQDDANSHMIRNQLVLEMVQEGGNLTKDINVSDIERHIKKYADKLGQEERIVEGM